MEMEMEMLITIIIMEMVTHQMLGHLHLVLRPLRIIMMRIMMIMDMPMVMM